VEGASIGGISMVPVTGDGNGEGEAMGCSHFWRGRGAGGEVAPWCQRRMTQIRAEQWSGRPNAVAGVLGVKDDEKKFGRWTECAIGPNCWLGRRKKYDWEYEMGQKDRIRNIGGPKWKRKKEIKTGKDFYLLKIRNLIQMVFYLKILQNIYKWDLVLFISSCRTKWSKQNLKWKSYD
jgi:hypothetical protein